MVQWVSVGTHTLVAASHYSELCIFQFRKQGCLHVVGIRWYRCAHGGNGCWLPPLQPQSQGTV